MEINTTNISLNRYIELLEIEKNFNKKNKLVFRLIGCRYKRFIEFYSDDKTFINDVIEEQNKELDKLKLDNLQLKSNYEDLKHKLQILEMHSICDKNLIKTYQNKNLIERIFNL
jgi:hypothetical protein